MSDPEPEPVEDRARRFLANVQTLLHHTQLNISRDSNNFAIALVLAEEFHAMELRFEQRLEERVQERVRELVAQRVPFEDGVMRTDEGSRSLVSQIPGAARPLWRCVNRTCPERAPIPAATAPQCYTCNCRMVPV